MKWSHFLPDKNKFRLYLIFVVALVGCGSKDQPKSTSKKPLSEPYSQSSPGNNWIFDKVIGSRLIFKNGSSVETNLFNLKFIGQFPKNSKTPYLIFSGRDCDECDANISIYVHSPAEGLLDVENGKSRNSYPGSETDYETDSVIYVARTFYGQVLKNRTGIVWCQKSLLEDGTMGESVYLLYIDNDTLKHMTYKGSKGFDQTLSLFKDGYCQEIAGKNYTSEP